MKTHDIIRLAASLTLLFYSVIVNAEPVSSGFTYQGRFYDTDEPAAGVYDLQCKVFDSKTDGNQVGVTVTLEEGTVTDGYFTVYLDFGDGVFDGEARWLELAFRHWNPTEPEEFIIVTPRQEITAAPYSLYALNGSGGGGFWAANGDYIYKTNPGGVGIGTDTPISALDVYTEGSLNAINCKTTSNIPLYAYRASTTGTWPAVHGQCDSMASNATAIRGIITSTSPGSLSAGVYGNNKGTAGEGVGVRGLHDGTGVGVYGESINGKGVQGDSENGFAGYFTGVKSYFEGKVGINNTAPSAHLSVVRPNTSSNNVMELTTNSGTMPTISSKLTFTGTTLNSSGSLLTPAIALNNTSSGNVLLVQGGGNVGIGTPSPQAKLDVAGMARVETIQITGADVAEKFPMSEDVKPGMVVAIDPVNPGHLCLSRTAYNRCVAGIASGANNLSAGAVLGNLPGSENDTAIALSGRVWVYCDTEEKAIEPGDMLTSSDKAGFAMAVSDHGRAHGAILGKAMTALEQGQSGMVLVLVNLQ